MTVRTLPYLLVFVLGLGAAGLSACGTTKTSKALIPSASAGPLTSDLDDVASAVDDHDCNGASQAISSAQSHLVALPSTTSTRLVGKIQTAIDTLRAQAEKECVAAATTTETIPTTSVETTTTDTTMTDTTDTTTTDTVPTDTTTTPTDTTTTTETAPPATTPVPTTPAPPVDPGPTGGVTTP